MAGPALAPIIVPAASAIAGILVGAFINNLGEGRRWKRGEQAAAYSDFVGSADALFAEVALDSSTASRDRALASFLTMTRAGAMVDVFGSEETADAAHRLWNRANAWLSDWDRVTGLQGEEWDIEGRQYRNLLLEVVNSIRDQLGDKRIALSAESRSSRP